MVDHPSAPAAPPRADRSAGDARVESAPRHTPHQVRLLEACAANLRDFGYPDATADNVMTTPLFWRFAEDWLQERADKGEAEAAELIRKALPDGSEARTGGEG